MMNLDQAQAKLKTIGQDHLLTDWNHLSLMEQDSLLQQIQKLDLQTFEKQLNLLHQEKIPLEKLYPCTDYTLAEEGRDQVKGRELLGSCAVGCLIVAGGQGSRLRMRGPKGLFPIMPISKKSLFQLFAERTIAAGKQVGEQLPLAIMTSRQNHQETVDFFEKNHLFGLQRDQLDFFSQDDLPLMTVNGDLFLEDKGVIAEGADGNGFALRKFVESGLWNKWSRQGVRFLNFVLIDNPLADPFDAKLIGFHAAHGGDVTIKSTLRSDEKEKVGLIVRKGNDHGPLAIVEYSEIDEIEQKAHNPDGSLKYGCANLSLFCFSMDFVKKSAHIDLPLHKAFKTLKCLKANEETTFQGWKFERFIFDLLAYVKKVEVLVYPRELSFAPLKNYEGPDSITDVQKKLYAHAKIVAEEITGLPAPSHPFELAPDFFYPTPDLLKKWQGQQIPPLSYVQS